VTVTPLCVHNGFGNDDALDTTVCASSDLPTCKLVCIVAQNASHQIVGPDSIESTCVPAVAHRQLEVQQGEAECKTEQQRRLLDREASRAHQQVRM
jgi:hypothetical protein